MDHRFSAHIMVQNLLRSFIRAAECSSNFARYGWRVIFVRSPRINAKHHPLGHRRRQLRSLRLYTRLGAESIAIIHQRRRMLLQLCAIWLKAHCRTIATYQKNRYLLGRRRWHFRSPRLYTRRGAGSIVIIHPRRGVLLQLCTV